MDSRKGSSLFRSIDWVIVVLYLILVAFGWVSIYGASYDFGTTELLSWESRTGKQFVWILCSFGVGFVLLMLEDRLYDMLAFPSYVLMLLLLVATIFLAGDVKGSHSWLQFGPVSLQPAEFAKCTTALALAKYMSTYGFSMRNPQQCAKMAAIILIPIVLIIAQRETGSALVYLSFLLMLYREGMPGAILYSGFCAVVYFVVSIRFGSLYFPDGATPVGPFAMLLTVPLSAIGMIMVYLPERKSVARTILLASAAALLLGEGVDYFVHFNLNYVLLGLCGLILLYLAYNWLAERSYRYLLIGGFVLGSAVFVYSADYLFNSALEEHQQTRIRVLLGMEDDPTGAGYNVKQSMIAIGSGGLSGKGFLNGTQTKLKYVPEQATDFIFCTVGEEEGFIGSSAVLVLFLALILRIIALAERQTHAFGRIYGYCVASVFIFHLLINVGMVLGLTPVIGIPLPFFSYGGSSLWGFTLLLFIFLRIDAGRERR